MVLPSTEIYVTTEYGNIELYFNHVFHRQKWWEIFSQDLEFDNNCDSQASEWYLYYRRDNLISFTSDPPYFSHRVL